MKLPIHISEKLSVKDIILKYCIRDFLLGIVRSFPSSAGVLLRMIAYKLIFKSCGKGTRIAEFTTIKFPERISVGDHVSFNEYDWIDGDGGIDFGNYISIGPRVTMASFEHGHIKADIPMKLQEKEMRKIVIQDDVWIGAGCFIKGGVTIGRGSIIGAGSVVLKNVEPFSIVAGNPAVSIGKRD